MKRRILCGVVALLTAATLLGGCGSKETSQEAETTAVEESTDADAAEETDGAEDTVAAEDGAEAESTTEVSVASAEEMTEVQEVGTDDMTPVTADMLQDGTYEVTVDSSSSMFRIVQCELTVADGQMSAVMTMGGKGYRYLYLGTGEEACNASEDDYITYEEDAEGAHTYTIPVSALDERIDCAAFSDKKEKWYDRVILFRADSLPQSAFQEGMYETVESLGIEDGDYEIEVTLEGGSGKSSVNSPALLQVKDGQAILNVTWSSKNYDYMLVNEEKYLNEAAEGENSCFHIPVLGFDYKMPVTADTVAMSTPHEIDYTLYLDSTTLQPAALED